MKLYRLWVVICLLVGLRAWGVALATWDDLARYQAVGAAGDPLVRIGWQMACGAVLVGLVPFLARRQRWAYWASWPALSGYALLTYAWFATYAQGAFAQARVSFCGAGLLLGMAALLGLWLRLRKNLSGEPYEGHTAQKTDPAGTIT
ncbi:MAG: hypothetical protein ACLFTK_07885 [Anaerolineales bacterium]